MVGESKEKKKEEKKREKQDIPLTVHLIPHTHIDAGWLKTMDEYFSGTNHKSQRDAGAVQDIFDTVI